MYSLFGRHEGLVLIRNLFVCLSEQAEGAPADNQCIYDVREHVGEPQLLVEHFIFGAWLDGVRALPFQKIDAARTLLRRSKCAPAFALWSTLLVSAARVGCGTERRITDAGSGQGWAGARRNRVTFRGVQVVLYLPMFLLEAFSAREGGAHDTCSGTNRGTKISVEQHARKMREESEKHFAASRSDSG